MNVKTKGFAGHKHSEESKRRMSETRKGKIPWNKGIPGKKHTEEFKKMMHELWNDPQWRSKRLDKLLCNNARPRYMNGFYDSKKAGEIFFRSSYEFRMYRILDVDDSVISYETEAYEIEYEYDGRIHYYIPDLYITYGDDSHKHVEVKPRRRANNSEKVQAKFGAAIKIFGDEFIIITEKELVVYEQRFSTELSELPSGVKDRRYKPYKPPKTEEEKRKIYHDRSVLRESRRSTEEKSESSKRGWEKKDHAIIGKKISEKRRGATDDQVIEIYELYKSGHTQLQIVEIMRLPLTVVGAVVHRRRKYVIDILNKYVPPHLRII